MTDRPDGAPEAASDTPEGAATGDPLNEDAGIEGQTEGTQATARPGPSGTTAKPATPPTKGKTAAGAAGAASGTGAAGAAGAAGATPASSATALRIGCPAPAPPRAPTPSEVATRLTDTPSRIFVI